MDRVELDSPPLVRGINDQQTIIEVVYGGIVAYNYHQQRYRLNIFCLSMFKHCLKIAQTLDSSKRFNQGSEKNDET